MKYLSHQSLELAWKLLPKIAFKSPRDQWVNINPSFFLLSEVSQWATGHLRFLPQVLLPGVALPACVCQAVATVPPGQATARNLLIQPRCPHPRCLTVSGGSCHAQVKDLAHIPLTIFQSNSKSNQNMLWFKMYTIDHKEILHTSRLCNCRDVCKISLWSVKYDLN